MTDKWTIRYTESSFSLTGLLIIIGLILVAIGVAYWFVVAYGSSNSTSNMTLDCVRMFYSDSWDKGYIIDLAKYCGSK